MVGQVTKLMWLDQKFLHAQIAVRSVVLMNGHPRGPKPRGVGFARDLSETMFLASLFGTFVHLFACSNSFINNLKHA